MIIKDKKNKCICGLWGIRDNYYTDVVDPEILSYEQYHFFPKYNDCDDGLTPVCYGLGENNCVCENVKNFGCNCDDIYNKCPAGYVCEGGCSDEINNTHDCGPNSDYPCIGTCRKDLRYIENDGNRNSTTRDLGCNCYFEPGMGNFGLYGPNPDDGICDTDSVCLRDGFGLDELGGCFYSTSREIPFYIPSIPLNGQGLYFMQGVTVHKDGQGLMIDAYENLGLNVLNEDACDSSGVVYVFDIDATSAQDLNYYLGVDWENQLDSIQRFRSDYISVFDSDGSPYFVYDSQGGVTQNGLFSDHYVEEWWKVFDGQTYRIFVCTGISATQWDNDNPGVIAEGFDWNPNGYNFQIQAWWAIRMEEFYPDGPSYEDYWPEYFGYCPMPAAVNTGCNGYCQYFPGSWIEDAPGCMDPAASNYDSEALWDNQSCDYNIYGCTDYNACNYNIHATVDNGTCTYPPNWCEDTDGDGLGCGTLVVTACNNPDDNIYVGDCTGDCDDCPYEYDDCGICDGDNSTCSGCTDDSACNYDSLATIDDGSCLYVGDEGYECDCQGNIQSAYYPDADGDGIGCCTLNDLNQAVWFCENPGAGWSTTCGESDTYCGCPAGTHAIDDCGVCYLISNGPSNDCFGCTNPYATNYGITSTIDDGSCNFYWDDTIYLKMYYWDSTGVCDDEYGICYYHVMGGGGGEPDLPYQDRTMYEVPFPLTEADCNTDYVEDLLDLDYVISTEWYYDESVEQPFCDPDNPYRTAIHMYSDGNFATTLTGENSFCTGQWNYNYNQDQIQFTYRSGTNFTIGEGKYVEALTDIATNSFFKYTELSDCAGEDKSIDEYHNIIDDGSIGSPMEYWGPGQLIKQSCANAYGGLAINYVYDQTVCPSIHIPTDNIRRRVECIPTGDLEISTPLTFDDLVNGFHGNRYRNPVEDNILPSLFEKGNYYVRKWDFHPAIKGAPDGVFVDRVWSIDLYTEQPDGGDIKSLPVYESDNTWHSMNGLSSGEYEINSHAFKMTYKNATNNSCCYPDEAIYKPDSPLFGGGLVCQTYYDNLEPHQFPGCRSVISALDVDILDYNNESRKYLESNIYPGQYLIKPENVFNRKWEYIYQTGQVLRNVSTGRCDSAGTNLWLKGEVSEHDDYANIPQRTCISENIEDESLRINSKDALSLVKYLAKKLNIRLIDLKPISSNANTMNIKHAIKVITQVLKKNPKAKFSEVIDKQTFDSYHLIYDTKQILHILNNLVRKLEKNQNKNSIGKNKKDKLLNGQELISTIDEILTKVNKPKPTITSVPKRLKPNPQTSVSTSSNSCNPDVMHDTYVDLPSAYVSQGDLSFPLEYCQDICGPAAEVEDYYDVPHYPNNPDQEYWNSLGVHCNCPPNGYQCPDGSCHYFLHQCALECPERIAINESYDWENIHFDDALNFFMNTCGADIKNCVDYFNYLGKCYISEFDWIPIIKEIAGDNWYDIDGVPAYVLHDDDGNKLGITSIELSGFGADNNYADILEPFNMNFSLERFRINFRWHIESLSVTGTGWAGTSEGSQFNIDTTVRPELYDDDEDGIDEKLDFVWDLDNFAFQSFSYSNGVIDALCYDCGDNFWEDAACFLMCSWGMIPIAMADYFGNIILQIAQQQYLTDTIYDMFFASDQMSFTIDAGPVLNKTKKAMDKVLGAAYSEFYAVTGLGDLNQDGGVNVLDVVALVNCVLANNCTGYEADINFDGGYNVLDVVALVNMVLNNRSLTDSDKQELQIQLDRLGNNGTSLMGKDKKCCCPKDAHVCRPDNIISMPPGGCTEDYNEHKCPDNPGQHYDEPPWHQYTDNPDNPVVYVIQENPGIGVNNNNELVDQFSLPGYGEYYHNLFGVDPDEGDEIVFLDCGSDGNCESESEVVGKCIFSYYHTDDPNYPYVITENLCRGRYFEEEYDISFLGNSTANAYKMMVYINAEQGSEYPGMTSGNPMIVKFWDYSKQRESDLYFNRLVDGTWSSVWPRDVLQSQLADGGAGGVGNINNAQLHTGEFIVPNNHGQNQYDILLSEQKIGTWGTHGNQISILDVQNMMGVITNNSNNPQIPTTPHPIEGERHPDWPNNDGFAGGLIKVNEGKIAAGNLTNSGFISVVDVVAQVKIILNSGQRISSEDEAILRNILQENQLTKK